MLGLIDESGDAGFKPASSPYFIMGMVRFDDLSDAAHAATVIRELQSKCRTYPEFKFSSCSRKIRDIFFENVVNLNFKIRLISVRKELIVDHFLRNNPRFFYNHTLLCLLENDHGTLKDAILKIDNSGYAKEAISSVKRTFSSEKIKKMSAHNSKKEHLIQLADMIVGGVARPLNSDSKTKDIFRWRECLHKKIECESSLDENGRPTVYPEYQESASIRRPIRAVEHL